MSNHYFVNQTDIKEKTYEIKVELNGKSYRFFGGSGVFSKRQIDFGTLLLINSLDLTNEGTFLDLGAGYGPVGIIVKKTFENLDVHQVDINRRAVQLCKKNSQLNEVSTNCYYSDGFSEIKINFDYIALNPPIRAGKKIVYKLYDQAYENLNVGGSFWVVVRKRQGAESHLTYLAKIFNNATIIAKKHGYFVIKMKKT